MPASISPARRPKPRARMLFVIEDGKPTPLLPWTMVRGPTRRANGRTLLTTLQAAKRIGQCQPSPERLLRAMWRAAWSDCISAADLAAIEAAESGASSPVPTEAADPSAGMIFGDVEGHPVPLQARHTPDAPQCLTVEQAARKFGLPQALLRVMWRATFA